MVVLLALSLFGLLPDRVAVDFGVALVPTVAISVDAESRAGGAVIAHYQIINAHVPGAYTATGRVYLEGEGQLMIAAGFEGPRFEADESLVWLHLDGGGLRYAAKQ